VLGIASICVGIVWFWRRRIPFGIEARAPAGEIRGYAARLGGIAICVVGLLMIVYSVQVACSVGWAQDSECFKSP
jgi:predicted ABC-type sugar transport system permease subunit